MDVFGPLHETLCMPRGALLERGRGGASSSFFGRKKTCDTALDARQSIRVGCVKRARTEKRRALGFESRACQRIVALVDERNADGIQAVERLSYEGTARYVEPPGVEIMANGPGHITALLGRRSLAACLARIDQQTRDDHAEGDGQPEKHDAHLSPTALHHTKSRLRKINMANTSTTSE